MDWCRIKGLDGMSDTVFLLSQTTSERSDLVSSLCEALEDGAFSCIIPPRSRILLTFVMSLVLASLTSVFAGDTPKLSLAIVIYKSSIKFSF